MTVRRLQQSIRKAWRRFFSPNLTPIDAEGHIRPGRQNAPWKPTLYVLPRAICGFSRVRLAGKNANARAAAKLNAAYRQGYADTRARLELDGDDPLNAGVWCWDGDFKLENGALASSVQAIPETVARKRLEDGARIVRCIDGFEGQVWRNGVLTASRWWRAAPSDQEWLHFMRAARERVTGEASRAPAPCEAPFRDDLPMIDPDPANLRVTLAPGRIAAVVACSITFFAAFQTAQIISYKSSAAALSARIENAIVANEAGAAARRGALSANAEIEALSDFGNPGAVVSALLAVARELPKEDARLANFRLYDQQLQARFETTAETEINIADLVSRLEASDWLSEVFVERPNDTRIQVSAALTPLGGAPDEGAVQR